MAGIEEFLNEEDEEWRLDVQNNFTYLTKNIGDLPGILTRLIQYNIISENEAEFMLNEFRLPTTMEKNQKLLTTIKSKGWLTVKPIFIQILRETRNHNCADLIQYHSIHQQNCIEVHEIILGRGANVRRDLLVGTINSKWWPDDLRLPTSFFERKIENELLTEKLKNMLTQNQNKMTVINQKVTVSGLGGIGKTTTAKSFAVKYSEDYALILWIDCSEGSLLKSFTKLARDLRLENRKELELEELACRSFEVLKESKCLFIFDNAECYVGKEGIRDVLPKNYDKFHVIITSRNRHWGQENIDGQISEFQLGAFGEEEGLEFMKKSIKNVNKNDETKLKILCRLLSYLPLALQIAVSTLNTHKITLDQYVQEMSTTDDILDATLDEYERTIKKTLTITLELIQNHKRKNVAEIANKILSIFGYITPDAVDFDFFIAVLVGKKGFYTKLQEKFLFGRKRVMEMERKEIALSKMKKEVEEATELLQFYSILSKFNISGKLSIHRLFQQVIRHNTKKTQNEILRQIFNGEGVLEYKLVPFTYYADQQLQKEFPKLKAELIDKLELQLLLKEKRFQEAVELSRLIKDSTKTPVSIFNFALCLKYNHQREEAKKVFKELMENTKRPENINEIKFKKHDYSFIMDSDEELRFDDVAWELILVYCEEKDEEAARQIFLSTTQMELWQCSFNSSVLSLLPQSLQKLKLQYCTISNGSAPTFGGITLPSQLNELTLRTYFVDDDGYYMKALDISQLIPLNLNKLFIWGSICVSLDRLELIQSVHLDDCSLILVPGLHITPQELTLEDVEFFAADKEPIANVLVNDFVDFRQMNKLSLGSLGGSGMSIDLCDPLTLNYLFLGKTKVVDWKKANWTVHKLELERVDFVDRTGMKMTEMEIYHTSVDISVLPSTIQKLTLYYCTFVNFSFSPVHHIQLQPNLKKLHLCGITINEDKTCSNHEILRLLVPNIDKWTITKDDYYLEAHKN